MNDPKHYPTIGAYVPCDDGVDYGHPPCASPTKCNRCYCWHHGKDINVSGRCPGCEYNHKKERVQS